MWIDADDVSKVGDAGFLSEVEGENGYHEFHLNDCPPRTNQSRQYRVHGWCGTTNNTAVYGKGVWRVKRITKNGRMEIEKVTNHEELKAFLKEHGFPDLFDACIEE